MWENAYLSIKNSKILATDSSLCSFSASEAGSPLTKYWIRTWV